MFPSHDHPTPLPEEPLIALEEFTDNIEKANQGLDLLKEKRKLANAKFSGWVGIIAAVGVIIILLVVLWPSDGGNTATQAAQQVATNITPINPTVVTP